MGLKRSKQKAQDEFNSNIAAILAEAQAIGKSNQNVPVQQIPQPAKMLKPAVVFHANTCPDHSIKDKANDTDYDARFTRLAVKDDGSFDYTVCNVPLLQDIIIGYGLSVGMDQEFRNLIEKYGDNNSASAIQQLQSEVAAAISNKLNIATAQMVNHGVGLIVSSIVDSLRDDGWGDCADALVASFSPEKSSGFTRNAYCFTNANILSYIKNIGQSRMDKDDSVSYDDAVTFAYNHILMDTLGGIQTYACKVLKTINTILASPIGPNNPDIMVAAADLERDILGKLCNSVFNNTNAIINEIVFAADALYANAEIPRGLIDYRYECDF